MNALVMYDSTFGNTRRLAQEIAATLVDHYHVQVMSVTHHLELPDVLDLLVIGGPTHAHGISVPMMAFLDHVPPRRLERLPVAVFDTRYRTPQRLSGSAASGIARSLTRHGASLLAPPESFFVSGSDGPLCDGEIERARRWARGLCTALDYAA